MRLDNVDIVFEEDRFYVVNNTAGWLMTAIEFMDCGCPAAYFRFIQGDSFILSEHLDTGVITMAWRSRDTTHSENARVRNAARHTAVMVRQLAKEMERCG